MAENKEEATLTLKVKDDASSAMKGATSLFDKFVITAGDVVGALKWVGDKMIEFAGKAADLKSVQAAFTNLAASQGKDADAMLSKMRELSQGTITDLELMKKANQALLLGLPVDRFGDMLAIARSSAKATGQSMEHMLESIVTGLGRGSKLMLDNLGIVFDVNKAYDEYGKTIGKTGNQLTDAEKKQAFINKALAVGTANAMAAGGGTEDLRDKMARLTSTIENLATRMAEKLLPAMESVVDMGQAFMDVFRFDEEPKKNIKELSEEIGELEAHIRGLQSELKGIKGMNALSIGENIKTQIRMAKEALSGLYVLADEELALERKKQASLKAEAEKARLEKLDAAMQAKVAADEQALMFQEQELALIGKTEEEKAVLQNALELKRLNTQISNEEDAMKKKALLKDKEMALDRVREDTKQAEEAKRQKELLNDRSKFLAQVATMQSSHNKVLATIGKAAAIAQITITTAEAAMSGFKWGMAIGGPALAFTFSGLAIAAGAMQAAQVAGVQLASGGIVQARPGGIQATIGEGGRNEAVVPLPDDFDPDTFGQGGKGNTYIFQGPVMGDQDQARQFAKAIDRELMELRRRNESVAFDEGIF